MSRRRRHATQPAPSPNAPSRERAQHDRITLAGQREIIDSLGAYGIPHVVETPLVRLYRQGAISEVELAAGHEFRRLYRLAYLDPLHAAQLEQRVAGSHLPHGSEAARRQVRAILALLGSSSGSLMASCAEHVLGSEESVASWALGKRWRGNLSINEQVAKGVLLTTLQVLPDIMGSNRKKIS